MSLGTDDVPRRTRSMTLRKQGNTFSFDEVRNMLNTFHEEERFARAGDNDMAIVTVEVATGNESMWSTITLTSREPR